MRFFCCHICCKHKTEKKQKHLMKLHTMILLVTCIFYSKKNSIQNCHFTAILPLLETLAFTWQKIRRSERSKIWRESLIYTTGIHHLQRKRWDFSPKRRHLLLLSEANLWLLFLLNVISGMRTRFPRHKQMWKKFGVTYWQIRIFQNA